VVSEGPVKNTGKAQIASFLHIVKYLIAETDRRRIKSHQELFRFTEIAIIQRCGLSGLVFFSLTAGRVLSRSIFEALQPSLDLNDTDQPSRADFE
jgi:hypothetical protein